MSRHNDPVIIVAGPTASGKSALAGEIAARFSGTLINADAQQVYADLSILCAAPGQDERSKIPHALYGVLAADQASSAAHWRQMAVAQIARCREEGRLPILVGGTGMYLRALTKGLAGLAEIPPIPDDLRRKVREKAEAMSRKEFYAELQALDPQTAARLHPNDSQRVARAYEVMTATGRSLSDWQEEGRAASHIPGGDIPGGDILTVLLIPPKEALYAACDARFLKMMADGALDEVKGLIEKGFSPQIPVMKALGVRELRAHLGGEMTYEEAVQNAQQQTRRYAKRQLTWFRNQMGVGSSQKGGINPLVIEGVYEEGRWAQVAEFLHPFM